MMKMNMKKLLIITLLFATICASAKEKRDDSKYLKGAVPEVNGMVTFTKSFSVPGQSADEIARVMKTFVEGLVGQSIEAPGQFARIMDENNDSIVARVCEWMVFKKKPLYLDRTRFRYQLKAKLQGNRVEMSVSNITYYYGEDMEGESGMIFKAEEWISDKEALNKAQTKLYPKSGKFRRKTVDRMEELFNQAMDAFETQEKPQAKLVRKSVVED